MSNTPYSEGLSKRQVIQKYGMNQRHVETLLDLGKLRYVKGGSPLRKRIDPDDPEELVEGEDYVVCRECGDWQSQITTLHLQSCMGEVVSLSEYKRRHASSRIMSGLCKSRKSKTEKQKKRQSETMKAHFQGPDGEETRKKISRASRELMNTEYRKRASEHLREYNNRPEVKEKKRQETKRRWEEGDLRESVESWHEENKELSNRLASHARDHIEKKFTRLHKRFKYLLKENDFDNFITEYMVDFYHIDEADPDTRIALEVDGCYWHSCPKCGFDGPEETLKYDRSKTSFLENRGWKVKRFWGHEIRNEPERCIEDLQEFVSKHNRRE